MKVQDEWIGNIVLGAVFGTLIALGVYFNL